MTFAKTVLLPILALTLQQPQLRNIPRLAPANEPGEQIVITGTVFDPTGQAPVPGARIFAYQPDARGNYAAVPGEPKNIARLRGIFTADAAGRYAFATIKPGHVPKRGEPAQIRIHVAPPGTSDADVQRYNWAIDDLWFEGDGRVTPSMALNAQRKGRFSPLIHLERRNGVLYGTANLHLSYR
jgi:protocatechuate 3,4-dioxygenase beta subunit